MPRATKKPTPVVSPGMGRIMAALRVAGDEVSPPTVAARIDMRSPEMRAREAYTDDVADRIVGIVKVGVDPEVAAGTCGVGKRAFAMWHRLAASGEEPFASFVEKLDLATSGFEARLVATVTAKAKDDAAFALRVLERRFPERWAAREQSTNVQVNVAQANQITPADARAKMRELFGELAAPTPANEPK